MITLTNAIKQEIDLSLKKIGIDTITNDVTKIREAIKVMEKVFSKLRKFIREYKFEDEQEEILFFKTIKPNIFWRLIYFQKIYNLEMKRPLGGEEEQKQCLEKELVYIKDFFEKNKAFYAYFRSDQTHMDHHFYLRTRPEIYINYESFYYERDPLFSTACDHKLTKLIANEEYEKFVIKEMERYSSEYYADGISSFLKMTWTGTKAELIELTYSIHKSKRINNGKMTLIELQQKVELIFNIDLGNLSANLRDMSRRKNPTQFLDSLKEYFIELINKHLS